MSEELPPPALLHRLLPELTDHELENLQAAVTELFHHQAILRETVSERELYDWTRLHLSWVREVSGLIGFEVILNEDEQLIYALPRERITLRKLRVGWTLVLLGLWYDYDVQLRAEGSPVIFSVEDFNESLKTKLGDRMPSASELKDILAFSSSRKLVRMEHAEDFSQSRIEVLPTIRFILPFGELEKTAQALEELMDPALASPEGESHA
jgi:Domain of unknown function (DUF4194)